METWRRLAEQCEALLRRYDASKSESERLMLLALAASRFDQARSLRRAT